MLLLELNPLICECSSSHSLVELTQPRRDAESEAQTDEVRSNIDSHLPLY